MLTTPTNCKDLLHTFQRNVQRFVYQFVKQGDVEPVAELAAKGSCLLLGKGLMWSSVTVLTLELTTLCPFQVWLGMFELI
jgi:hypothetical protein